METAAEVLLIIVAATLAVFLVLLSVGIIFIIRLLRRAEQVAGTVELAATAVRRSATAMPIVRLISNIFSKTRRRREEQ